MATQAGVNETTANDLIAASGIAQFVIEGPRASPIYEALAMQIDCSALGSNVCDIPGWDASPATEETAESDEVVSVNYSTSKKSATGVYVSTRALVTDQFTQDSGALGSTSVDEMAANIRNTIDAEVLELFKTASHLSDHTGLNLTIALWQAALALFKAQKPGGTICYVGSHGQLRDFNAAMVAAVGGQQISGAGLSVFSSDVIDGFQGFYQGVAMFESGNAAAADASNNVGGFVSIVAGQPGSAPTRSGLALAVWTGIGAEGVRVPSRHGYDVTASARVGFTRASERMVRGLISLK